MQTELKIALTVEVVNRLQRVGSWCGETNVQKTVYLLGKFGVRELDYDYILYKHGPFSFDLRNDLTFLKSLKILKNQVKNENYGPSIAAGESAARIADRMAVEVAGYSKIFDFIVDWIGAADVRRLERVSTAVMITVENPTKSEIDRSRMLQIAKPHIAEQEALSTFSNVDFKFREALRLGISAPI